MGGHVYIKDYLWRVNFILPICFSCNNIKDMNWQQSSTKWSPAKAKALVVCVKPHENTFGD